VSQSVVGYPRCSPGLATLTAHQGSSGLWPICVKRSVACRSHHVTNRVSRKNASPREEDQAHPVAQEDHTQVHAAATGRPERRRCCSGRGYGDAPATVTLGNTRRGMDDKLRRVLALLERHAPPAMASLQAAIPRGLRELQPGAPLIVVDVETHDWVEDKFKPVHLVYNVID
jgi:hypothetical protein